MSRREKSILALWFIVNLLLGLFIVHDFGISYDEPEYYLYAQNSVDAYRSFFALAYLPDFGPHDLPNYGPAFIVFPELALRLLRTAFPGIFPADVWHFSYFLLFQLGGLCLYSLARRWFRSWSAWGVLLLYSSQPLLWGHAFMNPKDVPFMVFFLFTIWSGFRLADALGTENIEVSLGLLRFRTFSLPRFTIRESLPFLRSPQLLLAGALLGMTMSIRLLGPLPGLIVILYLAFTLRQKSLPVITAYLMFAAVVMFLTWPALWQNPIDHWMDSLVLMVNFPWPGRILFSGQYYDADNLPFSYLPVLLNVQLTESLLAMLYCGAVVLILRKRLPLDLFLVLTLGAILPLTGLIVTRATMYDNFRQILFLLPPLILLAGLGLDWIFSALKPAAFRLAVLAGLALPGLYAILQLHPYQYIYYNSFTGGTGGAFRKFELDYWCVSYREAALWLNEHAPTQAAIGGDGPADLMDPYLRPDLAPAIKRESGEGYEYFVGTSRYNHDSTLYPDATLETSIEREGAVLAVIKHLSP